VESRSVTREDTWQLRTGTGSFESTMATKEDLRELGAMGLGRKQLATKEDLKCVEDKTAAKNQVETLAISVEESGRDIVQHLLEYRGYKCAAEEVLRQQRIQIISATTQA
jgi:hypothetical protein